MIREGQKVSYVGHPDHGVDIGDTGFVLDAGRSGSHIRWDTGAAKGQIHLVANADLVEGAIQPQAITADSVPLVTFAVRETYESGGDSAVLKALSRAGAFDPNSLAVEIKQMIVARLRSDPTIAQVCATLGDGEAEGVLETAVILALRTAVRNG